MTDRDTLYLKLSCPFCLKVAAFLAAIGRFGDVDVKAFWPGDEAEEAIRTELAPLARTISFPTLRLANGAIIAESEEIVAHYAALSGRAPADLPFYQYVLAGPYRRLRENFQEIKALKERAAV